MTDDSERGRGMTTETDELKALLAQMIRKEDRIRSDAGSVLYAEDVIALLGA